MRDLYTVKQLKSDNTYDYYTVIKMTLNSVDIVKYSVTHKRDSSIDEWASNDRGFNYHKSPKASRVIRICKFYNTLNCESKEEHLITITDRGHLQLVTDESNQH